MVKEANDEPHINLISFDLALRDIISRIYGCPFLNLTGSSEPDFGGRNRRTIHKLDPHCNILPAVVAVETEISFIIILQPFLAYTLQASKCSERIYESKFIFGTDHICFLLGLCKL